MNALPSYGTNPVSTEATRLLDRSSLTHGGTYPGQYGYVGRHRADNCYSRGNDTPLRSSRHAYNEEEWELDLLGRVTVSYLLRRYCGWPWSTSGRRSGHVVIWNTYMMRNAQADHGRPAE